MIRRLLVASAGAIALSGAAFAADLPVRAPPPVYLPPPPPLWTGFYIGLNAGGTWSNSNTVNVVTTNAFNNFAALSPLGLTYGPAAALGSTANLNVSSAGFIGGGQIGYNYQFGTSLVAGIEADIQGIAGASNSGNVFTITPRVGFFPPNTVQTAVSASKSIDYLGTVRGRLGFLWTPTLLVYGTGGLAYGGVQSNTSIFGSQVPNTGSTNFAGVGNISSTRVGWTAGGGIEWLFMPNWSVKAEYLYYDLGSVTYANGPLVTNLIGTGTVTFINVSQSRARFNGNIVRAGLNYHFNWGTPAPVVAKY
ncbi:MAG: outer membrane beta-barrel protein [Beijerinckiaceae bacterium]|nr:outer membrane beta-barrel protein [Beijerinckiaceae bacterium]